MSARRKQKIEPHEISTRIAGLSPIKLELLLQRLKKRGEGTRKAEAIPQRRDSENLPLSFSQQRLWFFDQLEPGNAVYNVPVAVRIHGPLQYLTMHAVINEIARRHESLRTKFDVVAGNPVQIISPIVNINLPLVDLQHLSLKEREAEVERLLSQEAQKTFDLSKGPLLRVTLIRLNSEDHIAALTMHHIISDAWSMAILVREVGTLYESISSGDPSSLDELPVQFTDYTLWQRDWLQGSVTQEQIDYWRQRLAGKLPVMHLPTSKPRPQAQTFRGADENFILSRELSDSVRALCQRERATLFMVMLAAYKILLNKYTGQDDIIVGSSIANRGRAELEKIIGFLVNNIVLRTDLSGDPTFHEIVGLVRETALGAYANQDLPFEKIVEELQPQRSLSHSPLFQVMFVFDNAPVMPLQIAKLKIEPLNVMSKTSKFDLTLFIREMDNQIAGSFEYNTDLFDAMTIRRMCDHYQTLLSQIVADPQKRMTNFSLIENSQKEEMINNFSDSFDDI